VIIIPIVVAILVVILAVVIYVWGEDAIPNIPEGEKSDTYNWSAMKPGGAGFRTENFIWDGQLLIIEKSKFYKCFVGIWFVIPSFLCLIISIQAVFDSNPETGMFTIIGFGVLGFVIVGFFVRWVKEKENRYFDFDDHYFHYSNGYVDLSDVVGLQILQERVSGGIESDSTALSFELNLLLEPGVRVNVVDHGDKEHIEEYSKQIAGKLEIEIIRNF